MAELSLFSGEVWVVIFLALVLKLPLFGVLAAIWIGFRKFDSDRPAAAPPAARMSLCAYCGTRIALGYDAGALHERATAIASRTGQAAFDIETRLVREAFAQPDHYPEEPRFCPGCGEEAVWTPIEPIDLGAARPRHVERG
ncbi:MAG TPA: hypothetical protein VFI18_05990 [Gaiellales bacterium]|nr:hypothetical protein [Gaiellales bacterium]